MITTCPCQHCKESIQFDSISFEPQSESDFTIFGQFARCPNCGNQTQLTMPKRVEMPSEKPVIEKRNPSGSTMILQLCAAVFFVIGFGMALDGCSAQLVESQRENSSAIRAVVNTVEYGLGFVIAAIALVVSALCRVIKTASRVK